VIYNPKEEIEDNSGFKCATVILEKNIIDVIFFILYISIVIPIGLVVKLIGKDILNQKIDRTVNSYWIEYDKKI